MFSKIAISALMAGFGAGLCAAALQYVYVQPILLHAELFESGVLVHFGGDVTAAKPASLGAFDLIRTGLNVLFNALTYVGFAFLLLVAIAMSQQKGSADELGPLTPRDGLIWGVCGFIALQLAPAFGLPPELPGMAAAEVDLRQIWWFGTALSTAIGLWLLAFHNRAVSMLWAMVFLSAPHMIGAPMPEVFTGPAPAELASEFAARSLGVGLVSWVILGVLCVSMWVSSWSEVS